VIKKKTSIAEILQGHRRKKVRTTQITARKPTQESPRGVEKMKTKQKIAGRGKKRTKRSRKAEVNAGSGRAIRREREG